MFHFLLIFRLCVVYTEIYSRYTHNNTQGHGPPDIIEMLVTEEGKKRRRRICRYDKSTK